MMEVRLQIITPYIALQRAVQVICRCLDDEVVEVREMAATYVMPDLRTLLVVLTYGLER